MIETSNFRAHNFYSTRQAWKNEWRPFIRFFFHVYKGILHIKANSLDFLIFKIAFAVSYFYFFLLVLFFILFHSRHFIRFKQNSLPINAICKHLNQNHLNKKKEYNLEQSQKKAERVLVSPAVSRYNKMNHFYASV